MFWRAPSPAASGTPLTQADVLTIGTDGHSCALNADGTAICWGVNSNGQSGTGSVSTSEPKPVTVSGITTAIAISATSGSTCVALSDGTAKCWGYNLNGELGNGSTTNSLTSVAVSGLTNVTSLSSGLLHTCALLSDGTVKCWGSNGNGQLGDGTTTESHVPVAVSGVTNAIALSSGQNSTCALISGGTAKCWGYNGYGQLGNGATASASGPVAFGVTGLTSISTSGYHTCATLSDSTIRCFGYNAYAQLGNVSTTSSTTPVTVSGISNAVAVSAAQYTTCAILSDGTVKCWGYNVTGQVGIGTSSVSEAHPLSVLNLSSVTKLVTNITLCALLTDGTARCWGDSSGGALGNGSTGTSSSLLPSSVGASGATVLSVGPDHACAALSDGTGRCWGANGNGGLGDGSWTASSNPVTVYNLNTIVSISANGTYHTCAALADGTARCWGVGNEGQLGTGMTWSSFTPTAVSGLTGAATVGIGLGHSCAILTDGTGRCWGRNTNGQLGNGSTTVSLVPVTVSSLSGATQIAGGNAHTCAVLSTGAAKCWGLNASGQLGNGSTSQSTSPVSVSGLTNIVQISAGNSHTCAALSDGTARCWGSNASGQLGDGTTTSSSTPITVTGLSGVVGVSAGSTHSCAVLADGTVMCWGQNAYGELGNGTTTSSPTPVAMSGVSTAIAVSTGNETTCVLLAAGTMRCWGNNTYGQMGKSALSFWTGGTQVYGFDRNSSSPITQISGTTPVTADGVAASTISIQLTQPTGSPWSGVVPTFSATDSGGKNVVGACSTTDSSGLSTCTLKSSYAELKELWLTSPFQALSYSTPGLSFVAGTASEISLAGPNTLQQSSCSSRPFQASLTDAAGNPLAAGTSLSVSISGLGGATLYSDAACTQAIASPLTIAAGTTAANFYMKDSTYESLTVASASTGFTAGTLNVTVNQLPSSSNSTITGTTPVIADGTSTSTITVTLKDVGNGPVVGFVPTFSATDTGGTNVYGACSSSDGSGVSTCTLTSTKAETKTLSLLTPVAKTGGTVSFTSGSATKLAFTTQPSSNVWTNVGLAVQPTVSVEDAYGNIVTGASNSVTLAAYLDSACSTPASGTLSATANPVAASAGVAAFAGIKYDQKATIYLGASTGGLSAACSTVIAVANPPLYDQSISASNGTGSATYTIPLTTSGTNRLVLLAVTWKNGTAMSTLPTGGPGGWTSVGSISQGTLHTTQVFRAFAAAQYTSSNITLTIPSGAKSTAVLISMKNVDTTGTNGSGAIDTFVTDTNTGANPSVSLTPVSSTQDTIVLGFLGSGNATAPTAGSGFTLQATGSSSGGGSATTKSTTSVITSNAIGTSGSALAVPFTLGAIDWTEIAVSIKGP